MNSAIFDTRVWDIMVGYHQDTLDASAKIPLLFAVSFFSAAIAIGLMLFEWELMVRVFTHIAGEDSEYWSPKIMGLAAFILVFAVHALAEQGKHTFVMRWLDKMAAIAVPIYLLGIGLLVAVLLYVDGGINDMLDGASYDFTQDLFEVDEPSWLSGLISETLSPLASVFFCAAIGMLAIMNVYAAHHALSKMKTSFEDALARRSAFRIESAIMKSYQKAKDRHAELRKSLASYTLQDDETLRADIATRALLVIEKANQQNEKALVEAQARCEVFEPIPSIQPQPNTKELEKHVKAVRAITLHKLIDEMPLQENSK